MLNKSRAGIALGLEKKNTSGKRFGALAYRGFTSWFDEGVNCIFTDSAEGNERGVAELWMDYATDVKRGFKKPISTNLRISGRCV